jgi:long-chain acyl-CoA synthetase
MSITQLIHRGKNMYAERTAFVYRERETSFLELHDRVARTASVLRELDPSDGACLGILSAASDLAITSFFGASWAGIVPNYLNIRWSEYELSGSIDDFQPRILVVDDMFLEMGLSLQQRCDCVEHVLYIGEREELPQPAISYSRLYASAAALEDSSGDVDDLAYINYTGGTTGKGKGVMITHRGHFASLLACAGEGFVTNGATLMALPLFHVSGIMMTNSSVMMGNTLHILPAFDPVKVMQTVQDKKIVQALLIPTMLQMLVSHPDFDQYDLTSLRHIRYGASPIDQVLLDTVQEKLPWADLMQVYGQTECVPATFLYNFDHGEAGAASGRTRSAGTPCLGVEIVIRDEQGNALPRGEIGEITMRSSFVMKGYLNMPEQTAKALRDGWIYTGDAGYLSEDDFLYVVDRIKDMIVTGGENVYSAEVENAIAQHEAVAQCAVVGLSDEKWGEKVHAEVILKPGASLSGEEMEAFCREYLAGYKIPKSFQFVDAIPLTAVGKVDKVAIRALRD